MERKYGVLSNYEPTYLDKMRWWMQDALTPYMGGDAKRAGAFVQDKVMPTAEFLPGVGDAMGIAEAADEFNQGNYGTAAMLGSLGAIGMVPGVGDAVQKGVKSLVKKTKPSGFGKGYGDIVSYTDPETGAYMNIVKREGASRDASVIDLYVPEEHRNKGVAKKLLAQVMEENPSLMGQVSSKFAARNAYKAGRRPIDNPNATLEDVFAAIDEYSSVNMATQNVVSPIQQRGDEVLGLLKAGRAEEITDDMLDMGNAADNANLNAYLFENYDLPMDEASRMGRAEEMGARPEMYHGTDAKTDFQSLKPNTFLTSDVDEANAYTFAGDFKKRQAYIDKFNPVSGVKVPDRMEYSGILADISDPKIGETYATDNGVFTYKGKGKWDAHTDVGVDYGSSEFIGPDSDAMTIGVKKGLPTDAGKYAQEHVDYINRVYPGGDMGRVMPIRTMPQNAQPASAFEANRLGERLGADTSVLQQFPGADVLDTFSDEGAMFMGQQIPQQVVLDPTVARSSFARFDPRLKHLRNLSAGIAPFGALGLYNALQDENYQPPVL